MKILGYLFRDNYRKKDERISKEADKILFNSYIIMEVIAILSIPLIIIEYGKWYDFF